MCANGPRKPGRRLEVDGVWHPCRFLTTKRKKRTHQVPFDAFLEARENNTIVGWSGSASHKGDLERVAGGLRRFGRRNKKVLFVFGGFFFQGLENLVDSRRLFYFPPVPVSDYFSLYKRIYRRGDIGVAPLADVPFNRSKSALKVMEYQAINVLPVASKTDAYRSAIGKGFLVDDEASAERAWAAKLEKALSCDDKDARIRYNNARVRRTYDIGAVVADWERYFQELAGDMSGATRDYRRATE